MLLLPIATVTKGTLPHSLRNYSCQRDIRRSSACKTLQTVCQLARERNNATSCNCHRQKPDGVAWQPSGPLKGNWISAETRLKIFSWNEESHWERVLRSVNLKFNHILTQLRLLKVRCCLFGSPLTSSVSLFHINTLK